MLLGILIPAPTSTLHTLFYCHVHIDPEITKPPPPISPSLLPKHPGPLPPPDLRLLLMALLKRLCTLMVPPHIIQRLHLVDPNNPVLARERLVERGQLGPDEGQLGAADAVLRRLAAVQVVVAVVGHFVPGFWRMRLVCVGVGGRGGVEEEWGMGFLTGESSAWLASLRRRLCTRRVR